MRACSRKPAGRIGAWHMSLENSAHADARVATAGVTFARFGGVMAKKCKGTRRASAPVGK